ncbi:MAG TPA: Ig-like domain-containing protein, partial [Candidatus Dormibacteraeota bacterium]
DLVGAVGNPSPQLNPDDPNRLTWWGEYKLTLPDHSMSTPRADYGDSSIAGGSGNDMIFGGLGSDVIQGDGSLVRDLGAGFSALPCGNQEYVGANRWGWFPTLVGACRDANNELHWNVSSSSGPDTDYIEGGGGNDVIFGGLGQKDIVGGNSDLFGLTTPQQRPSGSNFIFGGTGAEISRENPGDVIDGVNVHAVDSDAILANNGDIFRLVGVNNAAVPMTAGCGSVSGVSYCNGYLAFNYDLNGYQETQHIVPRALRRLDYTPGGPDLVGQAGPLVTGPVASNGVGDLGGPVEIHAEGGDAFIEGGPANDVIFGGGQNDNIITGYGNDWVSGGAGDACIIGGDGRCYASWTGVAEPLYGLAATPAESVIATPGNHDKAVINRANSLKYTALIFPVPPTANVPPGPQYRTRYENDIIYGGWGNDSIHGGMGSDAISGAEAPITAYTNNYDLNGVQLNAKPLRSDWYHPYNPGNVLGFDPVSSYFALWNGKPPRVNARTKVMLDPTNGNLCTDAQVTGGGCLTWIMYFDPTEASIPVSSKWTSGTTYKPEKSTGDDAIFGDFGNDWILGGMGRVRVYGGWGNDLIDLRASLDVNGGLNNAPVTDPAQGGTPGTPAWEGFAYGGDGQDILFAGTAGDRLIDWAGNHNSYYVPFSPFGEPTVSRTMQPQMPQFLYQLSASDGADLTLGARYGGTAARNGEPFGEIGVVIHGDPMFHQQVGKPFNQMPGNLAGVARDLSMPAATAANGPIQSPGTDPPVAGTGALVAAPAGVDNVSQFGVPLAADGPAGSTVTYTVSSGTQIVSGSGTVAPDGTVATQLDLHVLPDGPLTASVTVAGRTASVGLLKSTAGPGAPTMSMPAYASLANYTSLPIAVTTVANSFVMVVVSDGAMTVEASGTTDATGALSLTIDLTPLADGPLTASVKVVDGNSNSATSSLNLTKLTVPPVAPRASSPTYINVANLAAFPVSVAGAAGTTANVTLTDGTHSATAALAIGATGTATVAVNASGLADGLVTVMVTLVDVAGNTSPTIGATVNKDTWVPAAPTITLNSADDTGASNSDWITSVRAPRITATGQAGTTPTIYVNGVVYTGQALVDGSYTVTATATEVAGNVSPAATGIHTLVIDATRPAGSFTITGAIVVNGQLSTRSAALTLQLSFTDAGSGLKQMAFSTSGGATYGTAVAYAASGSASISGADGIYTIAAQVTDVAGNVTVISQTLRLDTGGPLISYTMAAPTNGTSYDTGLVIAFTYSGSDVDNVKTLTAVLDSTTTVASGAGINVDNLNSGSHTIVITATDGLGNTTSTTISFQVHPTAGGQINAVNQGTAAGYITSTVQTQLVTQLTTIQNYLKAGNISAAKAALTSYIGFVKAKSGAGITAAYDARLVNWAQDLYNSLPATTK